MKTPRFLPVILAAAVFWVAACGGTPPAAEPTTILEEPPVEEVVVKEPTAEVPITGPAEASTVEPTPTPPNYAPYCEVASNGCEAPVVTMLDNSYCVEKVPYAIMSVPAGTTYESEELDFQCRDQMHSDGTMRVTCHSVTGKQLTSFNLELCNSACSQPVLQMGSRQCPDGYGYDPANSCCAAPPPPNSDGCTVYKVDLGACSVSN